ncbi:MAG: ASCH domain-containing protein [Candidatus Onthovivens sp.]|nr:ASCH domain-containing protein [Candidatus Onthovivens sp.]
MSLFVLKIREKFLTSIKQGKKTHEYRLATPERRKISIGDILVLVNNQNKKDYIKVVVEGIEIFRNWNDALINYWKDDFPDYSSIDEIKNECSKFYLNKDVEDNGIEVLKITKFKRNVKKANVLLDTNIVIHRESSNNIAYEVIQMYRLLDQLKINKYLHEDIKVELSKYEDIKIKKIMLSKIEAYTILSSLKVNNSFFESVVSKYGSNDNSEIDNKFLFQVFMGKVDFFITEDRTLIQKAKELYLNDVVLTCSDFLKLIEEQYPSLIDYPVLSVKLIKIGDLDINDHFFDSLREDYGGLKFNKWLLSKSSEDAYVFKNLNGLQGFLYLKIENDDEDYSDIEPIFKAARRLKVGTFKINSTGLRVGERFIKIIIDYAIKSKVDEVYVTLFEDHRNEVKALMNLMMSWGFKRRGHKKSNGELVLVKKMDGTYDFSKDPKYNYPFIKDNIHYGVLPIESQWHTDLFPDLFLKNEDMSLFEERPCGYAVEKIYICKGVSQVLQPGDIMIIYRKGNRYPARYYSVATGYCIIQNIYTTQSYEEFKQLCSNKSVFNDEQLFDFYHKYNMKKVLKLLYVKSFERKVIYADLLYNNIIKEDEGPRLYTLLSKEQFQKLLQIGKKEN